MTPPIQFYAQGVPKRVFAIDPGNTASGFIVWDGSVIEAAHVPNSDLRRRMASGEFFGDLCAIEMVACYGMAVGKEVFETCVWIGRFIEQAKMPVQLVYRREVKIHLCGSMKAKDANIRQVLIDKHGAPGTKKAPGKTYGISGHLWAALAVADYALTAETPGCLITIREA